MRTLIPLFVFFVFIYVLLKNFSERDVVCLVRVASKGGEKG